jgi:hypothetical protein
MAAHFAEGFSGIAAVAVLEQGNLFGSIDYDWHPGLAADWSSRSALP